MVYISKELFGTDDLLKYAAQNGIIDLEYLQEQIRMKKREELLSKHPYTIWEGTNQLWYTYLPDEEKGRVLRKRKTKEDIEDVIISYWKEESKRQTEKESKKLITLKNFFPQWKKYKALHTRSTSYMQRIVSDWLKYYEKDEELINKPLKDLDRLYLDNWAHTLIREQDMTKKAYYNMSMILRQCLDYAKELGIVETNVFQEVKINTKLFRRTKKKTGAQEVYNTEEQPAIIKEMGRRLQNNMKNTTPLAVMLAFEIGVRTGELCALKFEDIHGNYITIQRQEIKVFEDADDEGIRMKFKEFQVADYVKSDDGYRDIYLTETARKIIWMADYINQKYNFPNPEGYIFVQPNGQNVNHYAIASAVHRGCEALDMQIKTMHKVRKTYISTLIDSGLNIDTVRRMAGHSDERTTYGNYCFERLTDTQAEMAIEEALNTQKVIKGNQILEVIDSQKTA